VFPLARESGRTLRWRLHQGLKTAILTKQFAPGSRLPSTRVLAGSLNVSRSTVVEVFEQLAAEGLIEARTGAGSYVSPQLTVPPLPRVSAPEAQFPAPFTPDKSDPELFPHDVWAKLLARHVRRPGRYANCLDPVGMPELRQALASHIALSRGIVTDPDRIIVLSGTQPALFLSARVALRADDHLWCEDPCHPLARTILAQAGRRAIPVPVDGDGLDLGSAERLAPHARAAYVTPSHQFPTGAVMGLQRRLDLLDWAVRTGAWILENDEDSEFCASGTALPSLQGLDQHGTVIYLGTLNRITYSGMRVGYLVAPAAIAEAMRGAAATISAAPSLPVQAAMADFINEGHLTLHTARTRAVYKQRRDHLIGELDRHLSDHVVVGETASEVSVVITVRDHPAGDIAAHGIAWGLDLRPLAHYAVAHEQPNALVIGFIHMPPEQITAEVRRLGHLFEAVRRSAPARMR
jgi:GntR family transcriptional regulator/MocR family aminotransferase